MEQGSATVLERWTQRAQVLALVVLFVFLSLVMGARVFDPPAPSLPLTIQVPPGQDTAVSAPDVSGGPMVAMVPPGQRWVSFDIIADLPKGNGYSLVFPRAPLDTIRFERLDDANIRVHEDRFFRPDMHDVPGLTSTYEYRFPSSYTGKVVLRVSAKSDIPAALVGRLVSRNDAAREDRKSVFTAAMTYGALSIMAVVLLVLYLATRRRAMIAFVWFSLGVLFALLALSGHLYQLPALDVLGRLGPAGMDALILAMTALGVLVGFEHGNRDDDASVTLARRRIGWLVFLALLMAAALPWLPISGFVAWIIGTSAWCLVGLIAVGYTVRCFRNRVPFRWLLLALVAISLLVGIANVAHNAGQLPQLWWTERALQIMLRALCAALAISLVRKVESFRTALAQAHEQQVALRQQVDAQASVRQLYEQLRIGLTNIADNELEFAASHFLMRALMRDMGLKAVALFHFSGRRAPELNILPVESREQAQGWLETYRHWLENAARGSVAVATVQPLTPGSASWVVPMRLSEGKHTLLLAERDTNRVFTDGDQALLHDLCDVTHGALRRVRESRALQVTARTDALTGALNRGHLDQDLVAATAQSARESSPLAVLFVDIDHFKRINDVYGHAAGDHCLREIARTVRNCVRGDDLFGRYGGEEFIVVSPGASAEVAQQLGERLRVAVQQLIVEWEGQRVPVTTSIGIGIRHAHESAPNAMLDRADKALYEAKRGGRNQVRMEAVSSQEFGY